MSSMPPTPRGPMQGGAPPRPVGVAPHGGASGPGAAATIDPVKLLLKYKWILAASVVVGVGMGFALNIVLGKIAPVYKATILFEVTAQETRPDDLAPSVSEDELLRVMNTQVATIQSTQLLERVAQDPRLEAEAPEWANQFRTSSGFDYIQARLELAEIVTASVIPGTAIVTVSVSGRDKDTPHAIATIIEDTYMAQVEARGTTDIRKRTDQLTERVEILDDQLAELRNRKQRLIRDENLEALSAKSSEANIQLRGVNTELQSLQSSIVATEQQLDRMEAMLDPAATIQYSDTQRQQVEQLPAVLQQKSTINALRTRLQSLREQGIMPQHREYVRLTAELRAAETEKDVIVQRELRSLFDAQIDQTRLLIQQLRAQEDAFMRRADELRTEASQFQELLVQVQEIDGLIERYQTERNLKQADLERLQDLVLVGGASRVKVFQGATRPDERAFPRLIPMVAIGVFLCGGLTGGLVVAREMLDQRIKGASDVALIPRARVFGILPISSEDPDAPKRFETIFRDAPNGVLAEGFRTLRTTLLKNLAGGKRRTVMIVGGMPGSGASSIATNLAFACAKADRRVLLVDANYRRPELHKVFGLEAGPGLSDALSGERTLDDVVRRTGADGVDVLSAGPREKRELEHLGSERMRGLLEEAGKRYDLVLVDVAPAVVAGDYSVLSTLCDASILVVRALVEKRGMVARLRRELDESNAAFLGVIVNAVRASAGGYMRGNIRATFDYQNADPDATKVTDAPEASDETKAA